MNSIHYAMLKVVMLLWMAALIVACGGGGGGGDPAPVPGGGNSTPPPVTNPAPDDGVGGEGGAGGGSGEDAGDGTADDGGANPGAGSGGDGGAGPDPGPGDGNPGPPAVAVVADAGTGRAVLPGETVTLDASASTAADGFTPSFLWRQINGPAVTLSGADTALATFTPDLGEDASLVFEVRVSAGATTEADQVTVVVAVSGLTVQPVADAGPNQFVQGGSAVNLNGAGSFDPNELDISYVWTQTGGFTVSLEPGNTTPAPSFTAPRLPEMETLTFELRVNNGALSGLDTVEVRVDASVAPFDLVANAGADRIATEGDSVTLVATDSTVPAGVAAQYRWQFLGDNFGPAPALSGEDTDTLEFIAPGTTTGDFDRTLTFLLTVTVGGVSVSDEVNVEVWFIDNTAPEIRFRDPGPGAVGVDFDTAIVVRFLDSGGMDAATVTGESFFLNDPSGARVAAEVVAIDNRQYELRPAGLLASAATYTATLTSDITDRSGNAFAGDSWEFRVRFDLPPMVSAGPSPLLLAPGTRVTLDGSATTDPEENPGDLSYAWTSATDVLIEDADQPVASFIAPPEVDGFEVTLTVTDRSGNSAARNVIIMVLEDPENAVFVHSLLGDDANDGSWHSPVASLSQGLAMAGQGADAKDLYLRGGDAFYNLAASLSLPDGVSLYGNFVAQTPRASSTITGWLRNPGARSIFVVAAPTGIVAQDITLPTTISGLDVRTRSAAPGVNSPGGNAIALLVRDSGPGILTIRDNRLLAGRGGDGADSFRPAQAASGSPGTSGGNGGDFNLRPNGGSGGAGCNAFARGGNGGSGGFGNSRGDDGGGGRSEDGSTFPNGGAGGAVGLQGSSGGTPSTSGGEGGGFGSGGSLTGDGLFRATSGGSGARGRNGIGGGGGGGGGGGPLSISNPIADTGGGGGCGGTGGPGGFGGGGSFAIYLIAASPVIVGNDLVTVGGGDGGDGGDGGQGGAGGGGRGGGIFGAGGPGSSGAIGGAGAGAGGGGGGSGGPSYGIFRATFNGVPSDPSILGDNNYDLAAGGLGGTGGAAGEPGSPGNVDPANQRGGPGRDGSQGIIEISGGL